MRYPKLKPWELEPYFSQHMMSMTEENLDSKADIAEQLAWRDMRIESLVMEIIALQEQLEEELVLRISNNDS